MNKSEGTMAKVALISPCWMLQSGIQALLGASSASMIWHCQWIGQAPSLLFNQPPDVLIVSLHVGQVGLLQGIQFIQTVIATWPELRLLVTVDIEIHYLITRLRALGVFNILYLVQPLSEWPIRFRQLLDVSMLPERLRVMPLSLRQEETLTSTERHILSYLLQGHGVPDIALLLKINAKKVTTQKCRALRKLGIEHYAHLVALKEVFLANIGSYHPVTRYDGMLNLGS